MAPLQNKLGNEMVLLYDKKYESHFLFEQCFSKRRMDAVLWADTEMAGSEGLSPDSTGPPGALLGLAPKFPSRLGDPSYPSTTKHHHACAFALNQLANLSIGQLAKYH